MAESKPITIRLSDETHEGLDIACARIGCTKTAFVQEAISWALEREREAVHVPIAVQQATIKRDSQGRVSMPMRRVISSMADVARR